MTTLANTSFAATSGKGGTISGVPSSAQYLYFMANIKTDVGQVFPAVEGTTSADARLRLNRLQGTAPSDWTANAFVDYWLYDWRHNQYPQFQYMKFHQQFPAAFCDSAVGLS